MHSELPNYQNIVESVVTEITTQLLNYRSEHRLVPFWEKSDGSFITAADYGSQYYLKQQLAKAFPNIPFIGEETLYPDQDNEKIPEILKFTRLLTSSVSRDDLISTLVPPPSPTSLFWLVDPIDGTAGFIRHRAFAVAISLIYEYRPILSVMACPAYNQTFKLYSAAKGHGLSIVHSQNLDRRFVYADRKQTKQFCEASLAALNQQHHATRKLSLGLPNTPSPRRVESQYKYALVAEGAVDFFIRYPFIDSPARAWDHVPGAFLVEEAGGRVTDALGAPLEYRKESLVLNNHAVILASGDQETHETTLAALQNQLNVVPTDKLIAL
ncbi:bisphosphonucleoside 3(2')-phosphohydrolase-like protein [Chlamydia pneumoniae TW-183]|uniref:3'(2'),5'-bisphosphate nucleotidase n=2 Tax=Chlamydia pneumoniae TaxID=83558 RepID=Q9Z6Y6_CHLPN|nr:inositol monophosphatase family protein [Chlamydia pneumoniae]AAD19058.1 Sulfite Synthesis/biphosphate phosphatase [Chlamydia pneumoniae CWL029]AAF38729.1 3'(2'),5'-bisphosphate nucleotidase [Chlamydia pneumoniae AR39]AAP98881.1 bisphosphonucleoside 3(2')-phosphohydrolase-like protein [Chlamydia pneumoniae TW-183]ACZ32807.1 inositol monophosphatase family protein [Chlamydia pneumoniae LPCoLN]ETR79702.1 3'(2'),5'-bisphosphate nucleotidase [Chlamydia pneumoniae B21]